EYFYLNGQRHALGYFHDGLKVGPWEQWDEVGRIIDSSFFSNGQPKFTYLFTYNEDGTIRDISFENGIKNGRRSYNDKGVLLTVQDFEGKAGTIREYYKNGNPRVLSEFNKTGKLSKITYYSEDGKEIPEKELRKRQEEWEKKELAMTPEYPGGMGSFQTYLIKNTVSTEYDDVQKQVRISFVLNEFGRATEIQVIDAPNPTIERSLIRLIQQMVNWDMKGQKTWPVKLTLNMKG
ncbi:MAG: toxin-antitoxin system YwqK family antitoxin, partial [Flavisolibacter sp.]